MMACADTIVKRAQRIQTRSTLIWWERERAMAAGNVGDGSVICSDCDLCTSESKLPFGTHLLEAVKCPEPL